MDIHTKSRLVEYRDATIVIGLKGARIRLGLHITEYNMQNQEQLPVPLIILLLY
jgi:hypothetical protein